MRCDDFRNPCLSLQIIQIGWLWPISTGDVIFFFLTSSVQSIVLIIVFANMEIRRYRLFVALALFLKSNWDSIDCKKFDTHHLSNSNVIRRILHRALTDLETSERADGRRREWFPARVCANNNNERLNNTSEFVAHLIFEAHWTHAIIEYRCFFVVPVHNNLIMRISLLMLWTYNNVSYEWISSSIVCWPFYEYSFGFSLLYLASANLR